MRSILQVRTELHAARALAESWSAPVYDNDGNLARTAAEQRAGYARRAERLAAELAALEAIVGQADDIPPNFGLSEAETDAAFRQAQRDADDTGEAYAVVRVDAPIGGGHYVMPRASAEAFIAGHRGVPATGMIYEAEPGCEHHGGEGHPDDLAEADASAGSGPLGSLGEPAFDARGDWSIMSRVRLAVVVDLADDAELDAADVRDAVAALVATRFDHAEVSIDTRGQGGGRPRTLTELEAAEVRAAAGTHVPVADLAKRYGVSEHTIRRELAR